MWLKGFHDIVTFASDIGYQSWDTNLGTPCTFAWGVRPDFRPVYGPHFGPGFELPPRPTDRQQQTLLLLPLQLPREQSEGPPGHSDGRMDGRTGTGARGRGLLICQETWPFFFPPFLLPPSFSTLPFQYFDQYSTSAAVALALSCKLNPAIAKGLRVPLGGVQVVVEEDEEEIRNLLASISREESENFDWGSR